MLIIFQSPLAFMRKISGVAFTKDLSQVKVLTVKDKYSLRTPNIWLKPFMNTVPGVLIYKFLNKRLKVLTHCVSKIFKVKYSKIF